MVETILAIDPGMSSGVIEASFTKDTPVEIIRVHQVEGGLAGFKLLWGLLPPSNTIVCESFHTRPVARAYRTEELEPIRIEGWLDAKVDGIVWQRPEARKITSGEMIESTRTLARMGLRVAPLDVGLKDANDANSAMLHLIAYLRNVGHEPTLAAISAASVV